MTERDRTRSSSSYANDAARLPALPAVRVGDPALQRFLDAVREHIEVRTGARGDQFERAITQRDLIQLGLLDGATYNGSTRPGRSSQGSDSVVLSTPSGYRAVDFDYFARQIANSRVLQSILKPLSDPDRFESLEASVRAVLTSDIKREAAARGADVQRLETRVQTAEQSVAMLTTEVTAGLGTSLAGVRDTAFAAATQNRATAGVVTQISAAIGDPGSFTAAGVTLEEAMFGIASLDEGLYGQYTVKIDANGYVAGFGLAVEATGDNDVSSAFIVAADKFAIVDPASDVVGDPLNPPTARIPFGVDTANNVIFINGNVRINSGGPTLSSISTGQSTYTATVYKQVGSAPAAPSGGSFNFNTSTLTPPTGWVTSQPSTTTTPTYACEFTFSGSPTATVTAGTWSTPYIDAVAGAAGSNGESVLVLEIYLQAGSAPSTPTGGSYTFSTDSFTAPSGGWSRTMPASSTTPTYRSACRFATSTPASPVAAGTWSTPVIVAQNGAAGSTGATGTRGTRQLYDSSSSYTASYNNGAGAGAPSYAAQATTLIAAATSGSTPTTPIKGDTVTFSHTSGTYTYTITHNGTSWVAPGVIIDGSLLVTGSITTSHLSSSVSISTSGYVYAAGNSSYTIVDPSSGTGAAGTASGFFNAATGAKFGVVGYTADSGGAGVYGYDSNVSNGRGVAGRGVLGVYGVATVSGGAGGYFQSYSGSERAIEAIGYIHTTQYVEADSYLQAPNLFLEQTPTTGAGTATFPGNNKPGASTSCQWIEIATNSGSRYIPCWA